MLEVWSNIYIYHEVPSGQCNFLKDDSIGAMYFFKMALADQLKIAPSEQCNFFKMAPAEQCIFLKWLQQISVIFFTCQSNV